MLLCPADVEDSRSKEIFRPLEVTYPAIDRVDVLISYWLKSQPLNQDVEVTLEKKSINGDGNGVGAVWAAWSTTLTHSKHGTSLRKIKQLIEVKSVIPNQQIVLIITIDPTSVVTGGLCKQNAKAMPPAYLTVTAVSKGASTELTAKLASRIPALFQVFPKEILLCPCFWPHFIILGAMMLVCCPCCTYAATTTGKQTLGNQCDQGLSAIKSAVEKGPQQQVMSDNAPLSYVSPPSYGAVAPVSPSYDDTAKNAFCTKCGNPMPGQDVFCGKCGSRR